MSFAASTCLEAVGQMRDLAMKSFIANAKS